MIIKSFSINYEKLFSDYKINLIYGENFHLKTEILNKLTQVFKKNEFKTKFIKEDELLKDIEILDNYLNQDSLFGEKEILIIQEASDKLLDYINFSEIDKKLILVTNNLTKKNSLRNKAEKEKIISCIACYEDDEKTLQSLLRNGLTKFGIKVPYEAIDQLFNINKLNRNDINSGLEKLELITKDKKLDSETFSSLFNTTSSFDAFEISNALLSGDKKALNKILSSFYHFSINFNEVLGPLKYKINKLIDIYEYNENETKIAVLVDTYKPPIFWKEKNIIQTQLSKWNKNELDTLLDKINEIEILCKLNYEIAETIFNKFLLDIVTKRVLTNTYF
ncbi:DNA polymerase III subunit delta [Candidatus Pelagibacter sp. HIMB1517]|uniref:DNA polymerase III subunit delta n=1 Tax=Candidatus Pelagibacter sp. HIMB1517 TaxID=3413341 RepID=UPI003F82635B